MTAVKAVDDSPDPKAGKSRPKSGTSFSYYDLDQSVEVARTMHRQAGGTCDRAQLAAMLGYSGINNGSFLTRVSAAKLFGLIEEIEGRRLQVSVRGRAIIAPVTPPDESRARLEAFLSIELFKAVYDRFYGGTLPGEAGLRNLLENEYHVVPKAVAMACRVMIASAEQAGLFTTAGPTRMVAPVTLPGATPPTPTPPIEVREQSQHGGGNGGNGGGRGGDTGEGIDPAFLAMLRRLPNPAEPLSEKRRKTAIEAFSNILDLVYPET
jgi:hypothetical protein